MPPVTLAQVTDTHLLADAQGILRGCSPAENLKQILNHLSAFPLDALLLTGDLAEAGEPEAYQHLLNLLRPLDLPIYWLGGNHDCLTHAHEILSPHYPGVTEHCRSVLLGEWHLILLNSVLPTAQWGEGYLRDTTLRQLETLLLTHPDRPTVIVLHHHPLPVGMDWLDQIAVQNGAELLTQLDRFPQVKIVLFGHIHWAFEHHHASKAFYGCPASSLQVTPPAPIPPIQEPGFRLLTLWPDGTHQTQVHRLPCGGCSSAGISLNEP
ncbi:MAG: metallophosphoesterase family protein [Prochlorotrichaceae cyanobacterium]